MQRWKDDTNFTNDWAGVPAPEADGVARRAWTARRSRPASAARSFPGIEAGGLSAGNRPIVEAGVLQRGVSHQPRHVTPGSISASMALPWQADFYACGSNWWPVPRPNEVIPQGTSSYE